MAEAEFNHDYDLEAVETVGKLHHAFIHCIGNTTLKAAYFPRTIRWYTLALWLATIIPPGVAWAVQAAVQNDFGWIGGLILEVVLMIWVLFPTIKYCIQRGLPVEYRTLGIIGPQTSHAKSLHLPLLKLLFFKRHIATHLDINHEKIKRSIEFVELSMKDAPPSWSTYFRHPATTIVISSFFALTSAWLIKWLNTTEAEIQTFFAIGVFFAWILGLGLAAFNWKYADSHSRWVFLRTLRWLELIMRPKSAST